MRRLLLSLMCFLLSTATSHAGPDHHEKRWPSDAHRVLTVFDAAGKAVGRLASFGRFDGVFLTVNGALVFVPLTLVNVNFAPSQSAKYQWLTVDSASGCGESPAIPIESGPRPSVATRTGEEVTLSIAADTSSSPCSASLISGQTSQSTTFPVESTYALTAHFPEPLTIDVDRADSRRPGNDEDRLPMVYDGQGKPVGPLESYLGAKGVFLLIDGSPVFVQVNHKRVPPTQYSASQFEWTGYTDVPYASHDCGAGLLVVDTGSPTPAMTVRHGVDVTVFVADRVPSIDADVGSFRLTDLSGATSCEVTSLPRSDVWTIKSAYPLTQHHPEPLRIAY